MRLRKPVEPRVDRADERVGSADAGSRRRRRAGRPRSMPRREPAEVLHPELAVAVGEGDELVAGGARSRTGAPRRSPGWSGGGRPGRRPDASAASRSAMRRRRVARAVVDDDDLERLGERGQRLERLVDQRLDVRLLVVGGEEVRQARDAHGSGDGRLGVGHAAQDMSRRAGASPAQRDAPVDAPRVDRDRRPDQRDGRDRRPPSGRGRAPRGPARTARSRC